MSILGFPYFGKLPFSCRDCVLTDPRTSKRLRQGARVGRRSSKLPLAVTLEYQQGVVKACFFPTPLPRMSDHPNVVSQQNREVLLLLAVGGLLLRGDA